MTEYLFWLSVLGVAFVYIGYPLSLLLLPKRPVKTCGTWEYPYITVITSAYNEELHIEQTIRNKLEIDYPQDKIQIIVTSDSSEDRTDEIIKSINDDRITFIRQEPRQGKTAALNNMLNLAKGKIVVFSDANSIYEKDALKQLISKFADPEVGYVTGKMMYQNYAGPGSGVGCSGYMRYENWIRDLESQVGSVVGVDGGIDAVRKELYQPMRADHLPDFMLPLRVIEQGFRVVFASDALLYEDALRETEDEFRMRVRVCLRAFHTLYEQRKLLLPKYGVFSYQLLVHKVLRYMVFVPALVAFLANLMLCGEGGLYTLTMVAQSLFYGVAFGAYHKLINSSHPLVGFPLYFGLVNAAAAIAFVKFLKGEKQVIWTPRKGN